MCIKLIIKPSPRFFFIVCSDSFTWWFISIALVLQVIIVIRTWLIICFMVCLYVVYIQIVKVSKATEAVRQLKGSAPYEMTFTVSTNYIACMCVFLSLVLIQHCCVIRYIHVLGSLEPKSEMFALFFRILCQLSVVELTLFVQHLNSSTRKWMLFRRGFTSLERICR